jgi:hypothetical protein
MCTSLGEDVERKTCACIVKTYEQVIADKWQRINSQVALYLACASTCACDTARIARSISAWILGFLSMAI